MFSDSAARRDLEAIIHPAVRAAIDRFLADAPPATPFAVADIPLLFETGRAGEFDVVVVAACPPAMQIERVMVRDKSTRAQAEQRLAAQWPIDDKVKRADYVIDTGGSFEATDAAVDAVIAALRSRARPDSPSAHISAEACRAAAMRSSTNEFHSWQCGHCHSSSVLR